MLMETIDQKSMMDAQKIKRKESKHNIKNSHQITKNKRRKEQTKTAKTIRKQKNFNKYITINNDM